MKNRNIWGYRQHTRRHVSIADVLHNVRIVQRLSRGLERVKQRNAVQADAHRAARGTCGTYRLRMRARTHAAARTMHAIQMDGLSITRPQRRSHAMQLRNTRLHTCETGSGEALIVYVVAFVLGQS